MTGINKHEKPGIRRLGIVSVLSVPIIATYLFVSSHGTDTGDSYGSYKAKSFEKFTTQDLAYMAQDTEAVPKPEPTQVFIKNDKHEDELTLATPKQNTPFFNHKKVEDILVGLDIDLSQGVILNEQTRFNLEYAMSLLPPNLNEVQLSELRKIISQTFPGEAGADLAQLVLDFYRLSEADEALDKSITASRSREDALLHMENLIELREKLLGEELAHKLYGNDLEALVETIELSQNYQKHPEKQKNNTRYEDMELYLTGVDQKERDSIIELEKEVSRLKKQGASDEEIYQVRAERFGNDAASSMRIVDRIAQEWEDKYQSYLSKKQYIMEAGLSEKDKKEQIIELLKEHYGPLEWEAAQAYDNDKVRLHAMNFQQ